MKHFIGNEEERNRTMASSNIDDRTLHEVSLRFALASLRVRRANTANLHGILVLNNKVYLHPFLKSVMADVASAMCSYNLVSAPRALSLAIHFLTTLLLLQVNNSWACQSSKLQNEILKDEVSCPRGRSRRATPCCG